MFFRPQTVPTDSHALVWDGFGPPDVRNIEGAIEQALIYADPADEDITDDGDFCPDTWPVYNIDLPELFKYDAYECRNVYVGHFDLVYKSIKSKEIRFTFGEGRMDGPVKPNAENTRWVPDEDSWNYEHFELELYVELNLGLLRVVID